ncbi:hypothetical protein CFAM422_007589 [Trichoderma lentiforme]|uniref:Uncharacterized protein n=1 Tax=Trichoderma lentiforme TaxID=1567552 RepID=A0A9P4XCS4_9HYPO|nr:hypothetical protein CFAM422_007589 [Trichoderma lentiforme]
MGDSDYDIDDLFDNLLQLPPELLLVVIDVINHLQDWLRGLVHDDMPMNAPELILDPDELLEYLPRCIPNSWGFPQNHRAHATGRYQYIQQPPARRSIA